MKKICTIIGDIILLVGLSFLKDITLNFYSSDYLFKKSQNLKEELRQLCHGLLHKES